MTWLDGIGGRVAVISPHLDDAVFSLGTAMVDMTVAGIEVVVVTVFAGDTSSLSRAGVWDERSGFTTEGAAARHRALENDEALHDLDAHGVNLGFRDSSHLQRRDSATIVAALAAVIDHDTLMVPGWPLSNPDHSWAAMMALRAVPDIKTYLYAEQPYGRWLGAGAPNTSPLVGHGFWQPIANRAETQPRKRLAVSRYGTQLALLQQEMSKLELGGRTIEEAITTAVEWLTPARDARIPT